MTTDVAVAPRATPSDLSIFDRFGPVVVVVAAIIVIWYAAAVWLNAPMQREKFANAGQADVSITEFVSATWAQDRPVLPSPHQVVSEFWKTTFDVAVTSKKSLVYHAWVTLSATLLGFVIGGVLGVLLAVGIVYVPVLEKSLMPWVIASQTIPILAIAPMIIVVMSSLGITGLLPKAMISTYLSFFPVTVGMVKGLNSPDHMHLDLMRTYAATDLQTFAKLRMPASLPFLFTSLKVGIAGSLVGAIVGELPTGASAGLGARLLSGSYYGQTAQIWAALLMASLMAASLVALVGHAETMIRRARGGR